MNYEQLFIILAVAVFLYSLGKLIGAMFTLAVTRKALQVVKARDATIVNHKVEDIRIRDNRIHRALVSSGKSDLTRRFRWLK